MHTRNLELWLELMDQHKVFSDEESPHYEYVNDFLSGLMEGNHLTQREVICLQGLLQCVVAHSLEYFEEHGSCP